MSAKLAGGLRAVFEDEGNPALMISGKSGAVLLRCQVLPSGPNAGAVGRAVVRSVCRDLTVSTDVQDVLLQGVGELAANVHRHADFNAAMGKVAWLYIGTLAGCLIVDVWDPDPKVPPFDMAADRDNADPRMPGFGSLRESGRGLHIVSALVTERDGAYGVEERDGGKSVWFGLPIFDFPGNRA